MSTSSPNEARLNLFKKYRAKIKEISTWIDDVNYTQAFVKLNKEQQIYLMNDTEKVYNEIYSLEKCLNYFANRPNLLSPFGQSDINELTKKVLSL